MTFLFYRRTGQRVSVKKVAEQKGKAAYNYETGTWPIQSKQPRMAESIRKMSLTEFCRWNGMFSYKLKRREG